MDRSSEPQRYSQAPTHRGAAPLVLFALEPHAYSEVIGKTVAHLRPVLDVRIVKPKDLAAEMERRAPAAFVFSGNPRPDGCDEAVRWARFSPYEEPEVVRVDGRAERSRASSLEDLLGLVDRLAVGAGSGQGRLGRVIRHSPRAV